MLYQLFSRRGWRGPAPCGDTDWRDRHLLAPKREGAVSRTRAVERASRVCGGAGSPIPGPVSESVSTPSSPQSSPSHLSLGPLPGLPLSPPTHLHGPSPHSCQRGPRECGSDLALPWLPAERPLGIRPCPLLTPLPPPRARDPLPKPSPGSLLPALGDCALTPSPRDPPLPASPLTAFPHSP